MCGCPLFVIVIQFSVGGLKTIPLQEAGCVHLMTGCSTGSGSGTSNVGYEACLKATVVNYHMVHPYAIPLA
jgi:hypothetical protein